jgi:ubiquinone/menaquinone biosynthesis C-methylase UbiE
MPRGTVGVLVGRLMDAGNERANDFTLDLLGVRPRDRVLEVGFGSGSLIRKIAAPANEGLVCGVDPSATMLRQASRRNAPALKEGRVELRRGSASLLPYADERFDKVCAVHSIYFWPDPVHDLKEIHRVTRPGGLIAVTIHPKESMDEMDRTREHFLLYEGQDLLRLLNQAGFSGSRLHADPYSVAVCATARKDHSSR